MRTKVFIKMLILLVTAPFLTSCVRDVVLDAGEDPQVAVECVLKNAEVQELRLNFTKGASKSEPEPLTEAVATLIDLTAKNEVGRFIRKEGNLWTLDYTPVSLRQYRLEVEVPGYETIYAEDIMPVEPEVYVGRSDTLGILLTYDNGIEYDYILSDLSSKYKDKTGKLVFLRGTYYYLRRINHPFIVYGMNYNHVSGDFELIEDLCTDYPSVSPITLTGGHYVPPSKSSEESHMLLSPILEGTPMHRHYMIFPKNAEMTEKFILISGSLSGDWWLTPGKNIGGHPSLPDYGKPGGYLVFASMSDNYSRYLNEALRYHSMQESSDMTSIYLRDNIYSNIKGGVGIFAAISERRLGWERIYTDMEKWEEYWNSDMYKYLDENGRYHYGDGRFSNYYPDRSIH